MEHTYLSWATRHFRYHWRLRHLSQFNRDQARFYIHRLRRYKKRGW